MLNNKEQNDGKSRKTPICTIIKTLAQLHKQYFYFLIELRNSKAIWCYNVSGLRVERENTGKTGNQCNLILFVIIKCRGSQENISLSFTHITSILLPPDWGPMWVDGRSLIGPPPLPSIPLLAYPNKVNVDNFFSLLLHQPRFSSPP